jgi:hypothetical protein
MTNVSTFCFHLQVRVIRLARYQQYWAASSSQLPASSVDPGFAYTLILKMEAVSFYETSVFSELHGVTP